MAALHDRQLKQICGKPETFVQAQLILRSAQAKTGPGSGRELGAHATGLPAICAYIASKRLNNGDVKQKVAQVASCLQPKDFEKALNIVESALDESNGQRRLRSNANVTYEGLIRSHDIRMASGLIEWMRKAEDVLVESDQRYSSRNIDVICAVFFWTCSIIKVKNFVTPDVFMETYDIPLSTFNNLIKTLQKTCNDMKLRIREDWKRLKDGPNAKGTSPAKPKGTPSVSPSKSVSKSPSKSALRVLPTRDSPQKRRVAFSEASSVEAADMDASVPETPTKRRKVDPPSESEPSLSPSKSQVSPRKVFPPAASSSRVTLDYAQGRDDAIPDSEEEPSGRDTHSIVAPPLPSFAPDGPSTPRRSQRQPQQPHNSLPRYRQNDTDAMDVDDAPSSSDEDEEPLLPRRFRPVFLDHKQWYRRDPRLNRIWREAEAHKRKMMELYDHPFEKYRSDVGSVEE